MAFLDWWQPRHCIDIAPDWPRDALPGGPGVEAGSEAEPVEGRQSGGPVSAGGSDCGETPGADVREQELGERGLAVVGVQVGADSLVFRAGAGAGGERVGSAGGSGGGGRPGAIDGLASTSAVCDANNAVILPSVVAAASLGSGGLAMTGGMTSGGDQRLGLRKGRRQGGS